MENKEIARVLSETADLMEIAGEDSFRIRSYRNGATAIESYPERVADIVRNPDRKVTDISGIGKGLSAVIGEIIERGSCEPCRAWGRSWRKRCCGRSSSIGAALDGSCSVTPSRPPTKSPNTSRNFP